MSVPYNLDFVQGKFISVVHVVCIVMYNNAMLFGFLTFEKNLKYGFQIFSILTKKNPCTHQPTNQLLLLIFQIIKKL